MGYMHIDNLYKDARVLSFKHVYALEKIHGTSAHIYGQRRGRKKTEAAIKALSED